MRNILRCLSSLSLLAVLSMLSACGESGPKKVVLHANDQMQYVPVEGMSGKNLILKAGEPVELTLKNVGEMPKAQMGHNFVILNKDEKYLEFATEVLSKGGSVENEYLPEDMRSRVQFYTPLHGPGEEETYTFNAPSEPGVYDYVCTFQGHAGTMNGKVQVE